MSKIDVRKINLTEHGFSGYLARPYLPAEEGVVVILGGESVMLPFLKLGKAMAKLFAGKGFTAVSVSLFGSEGLSDSPDQIPLEHTINAVNYLKMTEKCNKITVFGMSMGSIVALGAAVHCGLVDNLVMMSPSHVAFEGVSKDKKIMRGRSVLTLNGEDIPYVSADFSRYKMYCAYENAYADKEREAAAMSALPIHKVKSRILLLAGEKDSLVPRGPGPAGTLSCQGDTGTGSRWHPKLPKMPQGPGPCGIPVAFGIGPCGIYAANKWKDKDATGFQSIGFLIKSKRRESIYTQYE